MRDRTIDALRAVAIVGVVLGHWLVSAVVVGDDGAWHGASPLTGRPTLAPATWFLQTLALFFFAAGFASARRHTTRSRSANRWKPLIALAVVGVPAMGLLTLTGAPDSTRHVILSLVTHPMWFLLVYLALSALAPLLRRVGLRGVPPLVALIVLSDIWRHLAPAGRLTVPATLIGWSVPFLLGIVLADGRLPRRAGAVLLPGGLVTGTLLVTVAGYPPSAVGVPGDGWSNLAPPSLFTLALGAAQIGVFLLVRPHLGRWLERPLIGAPVAALNRHALTVFCWHQTALLLVTSAGAVAGTLPGLLDTPTGDWPLHRLLWIPVFAVALAVLCAAFPGSAVRRSSESIVVGQGDSAWGTGQSASSARASSDSPSDGRSPCGAPGPASS
ncbi:MULTISPECIES: acyltransferase [Actinoplanes]|uniref:acyltransferase family protein n=1 Tax=Actinoplanes TaxID=1865 RepID=UPI0006963347|nr:MULTISPECIES: acyltransferase [Actinoplanes]GLY00212.1 acyltransferase [Actinoplanes sp. NBRC 101535]